MNYREVKANDALKRANKYPNKTMEVSDVLGLVEVYDNSSARIGYVEPIPEITEDEIIRIMWENDSPNNPETARIVLDLDSPRKAAIAIIKLIKER